MEENKVISNSFLWMAIGLLVTFVTGFVVSSSKTMLENVFGGLYYVFIIAELVLVIVLSARVMRMNPATAKVCFLLYSFVSGLTFSSVFVVYNISTIVYIFLIAAIVFGLMAVIGYTTKTDLTKLGTYLLFGLIAVLLVYLLNMFMHSSTIELIVSIICIIIFIGITAYDVQKIANLSKSDLPKENLAIYGALDLYLDFINIFLHLISIFGDSDN